MQPTANTWKILICSDCGHSLEKNVFGAVCSGCGQEYRSMASGALDLRLKNKKKYIFEFEIGDALLGKNKLDFLPLTINPEPEVDFSKMNIPSNLSNELLSYFPRANSQNSLALDLGCGRAVHKDVCERAGFEWIGLDYNSSQSPILGDAHALPFADESFEFILSVAVLEHIRFPFMMMREAYRVLKHHGKFIGTVAFLELFHGDSYYHHTHLGVLNSLRLGGFDVIKVSPSKDWTVLKAQSTMALFPAMPEIILRSIIFPVKVIHKLWCRLIDQLTNERRENIRIRDTTGSFSFVATRESL